MGNYNYQYKKYYQDLKSKNLSKNSSARYRPEAFEEIYGSVKSKKEKKDFFSSMANVFIYQLVVVIFMLMAVFYLRYSPDRADSYANVKAVINDKTYSVTDESVETFDISKSVDDISNYIKEKFN